jgi:hypothetical protein
MIYKLVHKTLGVKQNSLFSEFKLDYEIKDICFVPSIGFFFTANQCLGKVGLLGEIVFPFAGKVDVSIIENGYLQRSTFKDPSGICYSKLLESIMVSECGGKRIRKLKIKDGYYTNSHFANRFDNTIDNLFQNKYDGGKTFISECDRCVVWGNCLANYVFSVWDLDYLSIYGNGKSGFTYSNIKEKNKLTNPSGACYMKNVLYISDKNNNCIRFFGDDGYGVIGKPLNKDIYPEKIVCIKDRLYFMDRNTLRYVVPSKEEFPIIEENASIVSICNGDKDQLAILIGE